MKKTKKFILNSAIAILLIFSSFPLVSGEFFYPISEEIPTNNKYTSLDGENLVDNVEVECRGIYPVDILLAILWLPVFYIEINLHNLNEVPISINEHIVLAADDGRVLYDFEQELPFKLPANPYHVLSTSYFTRRAWKEQNYMWGNFDLTYTLYIPDDGSSKTLVFHGFMFNIGSAIFNAEGEEI